MWLCFLRPTAQGQTSSQSTRTQSRWSMWVYSQTLTGRQSLCLSLLHPHKCLCAKIKNLWLYLLVSNGTVGKSSYSYFRLNVGGPWFPGTYVLTVANSSKPVQPTCFAVTLQHSVMLTVSFYWNWTKDIKLPFLSIIPSRAGRYGLKIKSLIFDFRF